MAQLVLVKLPKAEGGSKIEASDAIFKLPLRKDILNEYVIMQRRALRQGTHSTKTRAEVAGTGKKPFRQKGTGNARQGSLKGPHQYGGGVAFGPKPRNYEMKLNRKQKKEAIRVALSQKNFEQKLLVVDAFEVASGKTKDAVNLLSAYRAKKLLLVGNFDDMTRRSLQNLQSVRLIPAEALNVRDLLKAEFVLLTKAAFDWIEENFKQEKLEGAAA